MKITLNWILTKSSLDGLKLRSCHEAADTIVSGVNIMDNPDTVSWIKPGELVLTTGYIFIDNIPLQLETIKSLKEAGCSALCIKTKRFFDDIPAHMLEFSSKIGLPIIELPCNYSLSDISEEINHQLYLQQFQEAAAEQVLYNELFNGYFQGKPVNEILQIFSRYINCSVFICNQQNHILWHALREQNTVSSEDITTFSLQLKKQSSGDFPYIPAEIYLNNTCYRGALLSFSNPEYTLCILSDFPSELPWSTILHVLKIIDFTRMKDRTQHTSIANYYDSFFRYVMDKDSIPETSAIQLCEYYGIPAHPKAVCALITCNDKNDPLPSQQLISDIKNLLNELSIPSSACFIAYNVNQFCLCCFSKASELLCRLPELLEESSNSLHKDFILGVSRKIPLALPDAFKEASFMLSLSRYFPQEKTFFFQDYLLFWHISKMSLEEKQSIYELTVKPLVDFDRENNADLTQTLLMYFQCHLNSSLAASHLYIHRNTFLKRMEKIQTIIDFSSTHHNSFYSIYFGLCIYLEMQGK